MIPNARQGILVSRWSRTVSTLSNGQLNLQDMNPIEHIWDELERRMKPYLPKNKDELWSIIQKKSPRSLSTQYRNVYKLWRIMVGQRVTNNIDNKV